MATPFLGEIKLLAFVFPPKGWAECDGQLLPINQNQALFSLLGTTYGGDGRVTFGLPDLRGRAPVGAGVEVSLGSRGGEAAHTLSSAEMPAHAHGVQAGDDGTSRSPVGHFPGAGSGRAYGRAASAAMNAASIASAGGGQPHDNQQPYLVVGFCIALQGIFPSRN